MSIRIDLEKCQGCWQCQKVCPGNLVYPDSTGKAQIRNPKDCWGCTACLKECQAGAIKYFLGPDIGGRGTYLYAVGSKDTLEWHFIKPQGKELVITVNKQESNKY